MSGLVSEGGGGMGRPVISRRQFLTGSAAVALGAVLMGHDQQLHQVMADLRGDTELVSELTSVQPVPAFTFTVERDTDLALLDFAFYGFTKKLSFTGGGFDVGRSGGQPTEKLTTNISLVPNGADNVITVQFPPQCIGEAAYAYSSSNPPWTVDPPPVLSAVSGPSRLAFTLPVAESVAFPTMTAADLLDWTKWLLLVPEAAVDGVPLQSGKSQPVPPTQNPVELTQMTSIEYPFALWISPTRYEGFGNNGYQTVFNNRTTPLEGDGNIADCWYSVLSQTDNTTGHAQTALGSAVWAAELGGTQYGSTQNETPEEFIDYQS